MRFDWREVVDLQPKGYLEMQGGGIVIHGPIDSVSIDEFDSVRIKLKWAAEMGALMTPDFGKWKNSPENTEVVFPNFVAPFVFEDMPGKGARVQFGLNILYIEPVNGLNPAEVEGLHIK